MAYKTKELEQNVCKGHQGKIKAIYLFNEQDWIWEEGKALRIKRKYGKFKRECKRIYPITNNND